MKSKATALRAQLTEEILRARERIYHVNPATPLERLPLGTIDADIFLKREDLSAINAYKWRGAYNCISMLTPAQRKKPIIAASAGNHAQGVALAARLLGLKAKIYMPLSTPRMKQIAVQRHGEDAAEIILTGDTYSDASTTAIAAAKKGGNAYIHPFDDLYTIAGQATIADEIILSGQGPFDYAFVQIGGGGLAAGVSNWLRLHNPGMKIIGVEGEGQACMKAAFDAGKLVTLEHVDTFCDGTAVKRAGELTFQICRETLDDIITVSNEEVCAAIETTWETKRVIPEPAGAMSLAGLIKFSASNPKAVKGKKMVAILCGANMDFSKLRLISASAASGAHRQKFLCLPIREKQGGLLDLLEKHFDDVSISAFQYGKVSDTEAFPVIAFEAEPEKLDNIIARLNRAKVEFKDISGEPDTRYRIINYNPALFKNPLLLHVDFPERKGALRELLKTIRPIANICYFNYTYTGETIGRAIMGFEFDDAARHKEFWKLLSSLPVTCRAVDPATQDRMLYTTR